MTHATSRLYVGQHGDASVSWPYPTQFHPSEVDEKLYLANMDRFLPPSLTKAIRVSQSVTHKLKILMGLLIATVFFNILSVVANKLLPTAEWAAIANFLNAAAAIASLISLIIGALPLVQNFASFGDRHEKTKG